AADKVKSFLIMDRTFDLKDGTSVLGPVNPLLFVENQLSLPIDVTNTDVAELATTVVFVFRAAIELNKVFAKKKGDERSLVEDQKALYEQLASSLSAVGVDGRACLLRFICEAQSTRIKKLNLLGKMLATLLTPKEDSFLEEYNIAATIGRSGQCAGNYNKCAISLFNIFNYVRKSKSGENPKTSTKGSKMSANTSKASSKAT
ncbi:hypothetical protein SK128_002863, partial [Halocaridina rubra]